MIEALLAQAVRQHQAGNLALAARGYEAILAANPRFFRALYLLGFLRFQEGRFEDAARLIGEAVAVNPNAPDAYYNLGCALQPLSRHEEALAAFDRALRLKPSYDEALINKGATLLALGRHDEAIAAFDAALACKPRDPEALSNRATALFELKRYQEAAAGFASLLAAAPDFPYAEGNLVLARAHACDWRFHDADKARLKAAIRAGRPAISAHGATLISSDPEEQWLAARRWVADRCPPSPQPLCRQERYRHDKIRLAYVSADFHSHATATLIAGVFEHHDRGSFDLTGISLGPDDGSRMRRRIAGACDRFLDVRSSGDGEIAHMLKAMEIDIAIDLKGHTHDARPQILARRPAPVQVNYLGHPGTMGAPYIDYIVADGIVIPRSEAAFYSEKIVYLPNSYQANDDRRPIGGSIPSRAQVGLPQAGFVFCSFNNSYKITPDVFDIWVRLVNRIEGSVLWLFEDNADAGVRLKVEARARGLDPARLILAPRVEVEAHLARHKLADLFLDTLPCSAHTTASDALWAGLPVLTCRGTTFAGRVAASLNQAIGLSELVTTSLAEYEALALALARDPVRLASVKNRLAENRRRSPLFDTAGFTRHLEAAFRAMWERQQRGEPPESFSVPGEGRASN